MTHILTREQSIKLKKTWKMHLEEKDKHVGWHHLLYTVMRGKNVSKAFTSGKTERRIAINEAKGLRPDAGYQIAYGRAHSELTYAIHLAKKQEDGKGIIGLGPAETKIHLAVHEMEELREQLEKVKRII